MRDIRETPVSTKQVLDGKLLKVHSDEVRLPDGSIHIREYVRFPPSVGIVPTLPDGRILLVRQWRHAIRRWSYELPGGKVDPGESPEEAARRELREETGWGAGWIRPLTRFGLAIGYSAEMMTVFLAGDLAEAPLPGDVDEFTDPVALDPAEAREVLENGGVVDSKSVAGLLLWLAMLADGTDPGDPTAPLPPGAAGAGPGSLRPWEA